MADDRDVLRRKTPPAGVRAQTAPPEDEFEADGLTPVEGDQATQTLKRTNQAAVTLRGIKKDLNNNLHEVRAYAEKDQRDHAEMKQQFRAGIDEVKTDVREVKTEVKEIAGHVGNMREDLGVMTGRFDEILARKALAEQNDAHAERTGLTYKKDVKLTIWKASIKLAMFVLGPLAAGVGGYFVARWFHL